MCLGFELTEIGQRRIVSKAKKQGYIRVYKRVELCQNGFWCWWTMVCYKKGIQTAQQRGSSSYNTGWHAFRDSKSAKKYWIGKKYITLECLARPEWIKNSGKDGSLKTILFTKLCFPKFPKRKVTVKEFKKLCEAVK